MTGATSRPGSCSCTQYGYPDLKARIIVAEVVGVLLSNAYLRAPPQGRPNDFGPCRDIRSCSCRLRLVRAMDVRGPRTVLAAQSVHDENNNNNSNNNDNIDKNTKNNKLLILAITLIIILIVTVIVMLTSCYYNI